MKNYIILLFVIFISIFVNAQTTVFKSADNSKQINLPNNKGTININNTYSYINAKDYQELDNKLKKLYVDREKLVERIDNYPKDESFKEDLEKINVEIDESEKNIESFKNDSNKLHEIFTKISVNTKRLQKALKFSDKGEIKLADSLLNFNEIEKDQKKLLIYKKQKEVELDSIKSQLLNNANEYYVKAQVNSLRYDLPNRFELVCKYYEKALESYRGEEILYSYTLFLIANDNQLDKAHNYLLTLIQSYRYKSSLNPEEYLPHLAATLNSLGQLQNYKNDYNNSEINLKEALQIYTSLNKSKLNLYIENESMILNSLGELQENKCEYSLALDFYSKALVSYSKLDNTDSISHKYELSSILNNLGYLQLNLNEVKKSEESLIESLKIRRELYTIDPIKYSSDIAATLLNLGSLYIQNKKYLLAEKEYTESLDIVLKYSKFQPQYNLRNIATIHYNISLMYFSKKEYIKSEEFLKKSFAINEKLVEKDSLTYFNDLASNLAAFGALYLFSNKNSFDKAEDYFLEADKVYKSLLIKNSQHCSSGFSCSLLNNFGSLQFFKKNYLQSEQLYLQSLVIVKSLALNNPKIYSRGVAGILTNLSDLYQKGIINKDKSILFANEAIDILIAFIDVPLVQDELENSFKILKKWDINVKEYLSNKYGKDHKTVTLLK